MRAPGVPDLQRLGPKLRMMVVVPLGDGMWLSIVRALVRATLLVSGQSRQQAVVATLSDGIERIGLSAGPATPTAAELEGAIGELFRSLGIKRSDAA